MIDDKTLRHKGASLSNPAQRVYLLRDFIAPSSKIFIGKKCFKPPMYIATHRLDADNAHPVVWVTCMYRAIVMPVLLIVQGHKTAV